MTSRVSIPGELVIVDTTTTVGETIARSGVRLTSPSSGPIMISGTSDPNGVVSATIGSLFVQTDTPAVWQNTDGSTAWTQIGAGGGGAFSGVSTYSTSAQTMPANIWTRVSYNASPPYYDTDAYQTSATAFTAPGAGYYHITAGVQIGNLEFAGNRGLCLAKNTVGSNPTLIANCLRKVDYAGGSPHVSLSVTAPLAAGDYVELFFLQVTTNLNAVQAVFSTPFTMQKVG